MSMSVSLENVTRFSFFSRGGELVIVDTGVGNVIGYGISVSCMTALITFVGVVFAKGSVCATSFPVLRASVRSSFALVRAMLTKSSIIITFRSANPT